MIYNHLEKIRNEIEYVKKTILNPARIKSMDDYNSRIGYLNGLQKAIELFSESSNETINDL